MVLELSSLSRIRYHYMGTPLFQLLCRWAQGDLAFIAGILIVHLPRGCTQVALTYHQAFCGASVSTDCLRRLKEVNVENNLRRRLQ